MANRPIYIAKDTLPYIRIEHVDFKWHAGLSVSQKKKSIKSLHQAVLKQEPHLSILEISTKSDNPVGVNLSAFNLRLITTNGKSVPIENIFQSSKLFTNGGPFKDLLNVSPKLAKKDRRLQDSGELVGFISKDRIWPLKPSTIFYDWIYINTLRSNEFLSGEIMNFNAFSDIEFNPKKSINCQARSAALYVSLARNKLLDQVLESPDVFIKTLSQGLAIDDPKQGQLF